MAEWKGFVQLLEKLEETLENWDALLIFAAIAFVGFVLRRISRRLDSTSQDLADIREKARKGIEQVDNLRIGQVPRSVTFGFKVLQIPSLEEMGVPLAGLALVRFDERLKGQGYTPCWINRGDKLLTYSIRSFVHEERNWSSLFSDPVHHERFDIISPVSGLLLSMRKEYTVDFTVGLQYQWCRENLLPVILVPNDEPPPEVRNFYVYDQIALYLSNHFDTLVIRDHSRVDPERLLDYLKRNVGEDYRGFLDALRERNGKDYKHYEIRELTGEDRELIDRVQNLRAKDYQLRETLVHLARKYGNSI